MKLAGILLMPAGCFIAISAAILLHTLPAQTVFCLAGFAIEVVGFILVARQHLPKRLWGGPPGLRLTSRSALPYSAKEQK